LYNREVMATQAELKEIAKKRRLTAKRMLECQDWEMAIYMMAMSLELALKAASCHALRLESYPESSDPNDTYFKSHNFDRLLRISGMSDIFSVRIPMIDQDAFDNWGIFTQVFLFPDKDYVAMRYDPRMLASFTEAKARELYEAFYEDEHSIMKTMIRHHRW